MWTNSRWRQSALLDKIDKRKVYRNHFLMGYFYLWTWNWTPEVVSQWFHFDLASFFDSTNRRNCRIKRNRRMKPVTFTGIFVFPQRKRGCNTNCKWSSSLLSESGYFQWKYVRELLSCWTLWFDLSSHAIKERQERDLMCEKESNREKDVKSYWGWINHLRSRIWKEGNKLFPGREKLSHET